MILTQYHHESAVISTQFVYQAICTQRTQEGTQVGYISDTARTRKKAQPLHSQARHSNRTIFVECYATDLFSTSAANLRVNFKQKNINNGDFPGSAVISWAAHNRLRAFHLITCLLPIKTWHGMTGKFLRLDLDKWTLETNIPTLHPPT